MTRITQEMMEFPIGGNFIVYFSLRVFPLLFSFVYSVLNANITTCACINTGFLQENAELAVITSFTIFTLQLLSWESRCARHMTRRVRYWAQRRRPPVRRKTRLL